MKIHTINTEMFKLDGGAMFGVVPKSIWNKLNPADDKNMCTWAMRCMLIEVGNRKILIDTGIGNKQSEKFFSYYYLSGNDTLKKSIKNINLKMGDITDVLLTHLHFDHCGGAVDRLENGDLVPAFSNATYWVNSKHWEHALDSNAREKASFLHENFVPLKDAGVLKFTDKDDFGVDEISFPTYNGHTVGMIAPEIKYKDKTIIYCADVIPSAAHIPVNYVMAYDIEPLLSMTESKKFVERALKMDAILYYEHDPKIEASSLIKNERGRIVMGEEVVINNL